MAVAVDFYGTGEKKAAFVDAQGVPSRDFLLLITAGKFTVCFPTLGVSCTAEANQGVFIPAGMPFEREILSPIDYHQFSFVLKGLHPYYGAMRAGRLAVSPRALSALMESLCRAGTMAEAQDVTAQLLEHLFLEQYLAVHTSPSAKSPDADVLGAINFMKEHLSEKLDVAELAAKVYLSHTGLIWKFRRQTGKTPLQYLIDLRMQLAKELLLTGSLSVCEIADRCGYANPYYFTNAFRKHTGKSPTVFRKSHL